MVIPNASFSKVVSYKADALCSLTNLTFLIDPSCDFNPVLTCVNLSIGQAAFISGENIATMLSFLLSLKKDKNLVDTCL